MHQEREQEFMWQPVQQAALIRGYIRGQVKSREAAVGLSGPIAPQVRYL